MKFTTEHQTIANVLKTACKEDPAPPLITSFAYDVYPECIKITVSFKGKTFTGELT